MVTAEVVDIGLKTKIKASSYGGHSMAEGKGELIDQVITSHATSSLWTCPWRIPTQRRRKQRKQLQGTEPRQNRLILTGYGENTTSNMLNNNLH